MSRRLPDAESDAAPSPRKTGRLLGGNEPSESIPYRPWQHLIPRDIDRRFRYGLYFLPRRVSDSTTAWKVIACLIHLPGILHKVAKNYRATSKRCWREHGPVTMGLTVTHTAPPRHERALDQQKHSKAIAQRLVSMECHRAGCSVRPGAEPSYAAVFPVGRKRGSRSNEAKQKMHLLEISRKLFPPWILYPPYHRRCMLIIQAFWCVYGLKRLPPIYSFLNSYSRKHFTKKKKEKEGGEIPEQVRYVELKIWYKTAKGELLGDSERKAQGDSDAASPDRSLWKTWSSRWSF